MNGFQLKRAFRPVLMSLFLALTSFVMLALRGYLNPAKVVRAQSGPTITDWQQFGGDPTHSGANNSETIINASNVSGLKNVFTFNLAAGTDASVVALTGVSTSSAVRDLVFVNSKLGDFYSLDAKTVAVVCTEKAACRVTVAAA